MKKRIHKVKLNERTQHSRLLLRSLLEGLLRSGRIVTLSKRAKILKTYADKEIGYCLGKGKPARMKCVESRYGGKKLPPELLKYVDFIESSGTRRTSGFTKIVKIGYRKGDASELSEVSLVDAEEYLKRQKAERSKLKKAAKPKKKEVKVKKKAKQVSDEKSSADAKSKVSSKKAPETPVSSEKSYAPGREGFLEKIRNRIMGRKIQAPDVQQQKGRATTRGGI